MKIRSRLAAALLLTGFLALPGVGAAKAPEEDIEIVASGDMSSWGFSPTSLSVTTGTTVTWRNTGSQAHSITSRDQLFDSRLLDDGDTWSNTFDTPGTYRYFCVPYPWMKGSIVVTAADDSGPRGSSPSSSSSSGNSGSGGSLNQSAPTGSQ